MDCTIDSNKDFMHFSECVFLKNFPIALKKSSYTFNGKNLQQIGILYLVAKIIALFNLQIYAIIMLSLHLFVYFIKCC